MNYRRILLFLNVFTIPMALYLVYRLFVVDDYEKTDYMVMFFMFSLLLVGRILKWASRQEDQKP